MTRQGLTGNQSKNIAAFESENAESIQNLSVTKEQVISAPMSTHTAAEEKATFLQRLINGVQEAAVYTLLLLLAMLVVKVHELVKDIKLYGVPQFLTQVISIGFLNELSFVLNIAILPSFFFTLVYLIHKKTARFLFVLFSVLIVIIQVALSQYFLEALVPLGADLWNYSPAEIKQTVGAAGSLTITTVLFAVFTIAFTALSFTFIPGKLKLSFAFSFTLLFLCITGGLLSVASVTDNLKPGQEFSNNLALNKSYYFYKSSLEHFYGIREDSQQIKNSNEQGFNYVDEKNYPFLHIIDTSKDVLSPFFNKKQTPPNFVFIVVEGLGRAFSNRDAYLGSFTPFLDSLSDKSLYWSNFLSAGGRTFAMLPSVLGSLPYAKNGFLELGNNMPAHQSLLSTLVQQGYKTGFYLRGKFIF